MNKKSLLLLIVSYLIWGLLPLYWNLLDAVDPLFILCQRVLWSCVFAVLVLALTKRLPVFRAALKNKTFIKGILPAALLLLLNWGVYIWAVNTGRVLEASLGYYICPLVVFLISVLFFKEKSSAMEWIAIGLAAAGVVVSAIEIGQFPLVSTVEAVTFAVYGSVKKRVHAEPVVSMATETLLLLPIVGIYMLLAPASHASFSALTGKELGLLMFSGVLTATPLMMYARGVNDLPFITVGFAQFITPTLMLLCGVLLLGESLNPLKLLSFLLIWLGLAFYIWGMVKAAKQEKAQHIQENPQAAEK